MWNWCEENRGIKFILLVLVEKSQNSLLLRYWEGGRHRGVGFAGGSVVGALGARGAVVAALGWHEGHCEWGGRRAGGPGERPATRLTEKWID